MLKVINHFVNDSNSFLSRSLICMLKNFGCESGGFRNKLVVLEPYQFFPEGPIALYPVLLLSPSFCSAHVGHFIIKIAGSRVPGRRPLIGQNLGSVGGSVPDSLPTAFRNYDPRQRHHNKNSPP